MDTPGFSPNSWSSVVSATLQSQWPTVDPQRLDDLALDLWRDETLRALPPAEAAVVWLRPVMPE